MKLSQKDLKQFMKLHKPLLLYTNQRLKIDKDAYTVNDLLNLDLEKLMKIRDALFTQTGLIDDFIAANPLGFSTEELEIISKWRKPVKGNFLSDTSRNTPYS